MASIIGLLVVSVLACTTKADTIVHENVVFTKVNSVATTRSRWLATFVIDLAPYDKFITKLDSDIDKAALAASRIVRHINAPESKGFLNVFKTLNKELLNIKEMKNDILNMFMDYRSINIGTGSNTRKKRALIPIIGKALGWLFGTVSQSDLNSVRKAVKTLARNQNDILHVVEESISILNASRVTITENRHTINNIIQVVQGIDGKLKNITDDLQLRVSTLEHYVELYLKLDMMTQEIKLIMSKAVFYLEHLRLQLNMLSLGHVSPSVITPSKLRTLLNEIRNHLPRNLKLPVSPQKDIFSYYNTLTCGVVVEEFKFLVLINIPLLDSDGNYEVYRVFNMPLPYHTADDNTNSIGVAAYYETESDFIAIDSGRSKFAVLQPDEIDQCASPENWFCNVRSPVYPTNVNRFCIVALFLQNKDKVEQSCRRIVKPNFLMPSAIYLNDGIWIIATHKEIKINVVCQNGRQSEMLVARPPITSVTLPQACVGLSDYLTLPPFYHQESKFLENGPIMDLIKFPQNLTDFDLWKPFIKSFPKFSEDKLPPELSEVETIPMNHLVRQLHSLRTMELQKTSKNSDALYTLILLVIPVVFIILYVFRNRIKNAVPWFSGKSTDRVSRSRRVTGPIELVYSDHITERHPPHAYQPIDRTEEQPLNGGTPDTCSGERPVASAPVNFRWVPVPTPRSSLQQTTSPSSAPVYPPLSLAHTLPSSVPVS